MTSKVNLGKRVEGVVTHFYLILDTCQFTLAWKRGRPRDKNWKYVTLIWIINEVACPLLGLDIS
jgi:hypothetical protein